MRNNQISLFTKPSTNTDDLSEMELKLKLLSKMQLNKFYETLDTHLQFYNNLYESVSIDQEALDTQDVEPSFHKRTHDDQDPHNDRWLTKKSRAANATNRRTTWFDLLLKSDIDKNEDHILGPSTSYSKEAKRTHLERRAYLNRSRSGEGDVSKPRSFESHMSKSTKPNPSFYNNDLYYLVNLSTGEKYDTSLNNHYATRYHIQGIKDIIPDIWSKKVKTKDKA
ncbi:hypothetical protein Tco_1141786 [Tanacetum coccineum]